MFKKIPSLFVFLTFLVCVNHGWAATTTTPTIQTADDLRKYIDTQSDENIRRVLLSAVNAQSLMDLLKTILLNFDYNSMDESNLSFQEKILFSPLIDKKTLWYYIVMRDPQTANTILTKANKAHRISFRQSSVYPDIMGTSRVQLKPFLTQLFNAAERDGDVRFLLDAAAQNPGVQAISVIISDPVLLSKFASIGDWSFYNRSRGPSSIARVVLKSIYDKSFSDVINRDVLNRLVDASPPDSPWRRVFHREDEKKAGVIDLTNPGTYRAAVRRILTQPKIILRS